MAQFQFRQRSVLPPVIKNLIIINVLVWLVQITFADNRFFDMGNLFALHDLRSVYFRPHQFITHMFMHGGFMHLLFNMYALWMFGSILENRWGAKRFLIFYMLSGLGAAVLHLVVLYYEMSPVMEEFLRLPADIQQQYLYSPQFKINTETVGASGAVFGCLAGFGYLFPNTELIILPIPIPIKAKWLVIGYACLELYLGLNNSAGDNVAHFAHLGGAIVGFLLVYYWNKTKRRHFY